MHGHQLSSLSSITVHCVEHHVQSRTERQTSLKVRAAVLGWIWRNKALCGIAFTSNARYYAEGCSGGFKAVDPVPKEEAPSSSLRCLILRHRRANLDESSKR